MAASIYDREAEQYDAWYDSPKGRAIFGDELAALQPLFDDVRGSRLEVGVGTGRFAAALGIGFGIDPAVAALRLAAGRGVRVVAARGEELPFPDASFGAVLFMVTLCFVQDPLAALREARRVLRPEGGWWSATFRPMDRGDVTIRRRPRPAISTTGKPTSSLARSCVPSSMAADFEPDRVRSALRWPPDAEPLPRGAEEGDDPSAGFVAQLGSPRA